MKNVFYDMEKKVFYVTTLVLTLLLTNFYKGGIDMRKKVFYATLFALLPAIVLAQNVGGELIQTQAESTSKGILNIVSTIFVLALPFTTLALFFAAGMAAIKAWREAKENRDEDPKTAAAKAFLGIALPGGIILAGIATLLDEYVFKKEYLNTVVKAIQKSLQIQSQSTGGTTP